MVSSSRAASLLSGLLPRAGRAAASALASSSVASSSSSSSAIIGVAPIAAAAASASRFFSSGVPMTEPLHGLVLPTPASSSSAPAPATQLTTLPNGAKIASENTAVRGLSFFVFSFFSVLQRPSRSFFASPFLPRSLLFLRPHLSCG